jgi:DNA polymerase III sliding clamp (beta) subunit (PCNA family)
MQTIERENTGTLQGVAVKASDLLDLITGAAIAAHSKADLETLNGVYIKAEAGKLTAFATDRYRLLVGELAGEGEGKGELSNSLIPLTDIKRIIAALKGLDKADLRREVVSLTRAGDILTVAIKGGTLTITIASVQTPPPYEHLFAGDPAPISEIHLNADFIAAFAKVPGGGKEGQRFIFTGSDTVAGKVRVKPIRVIIPHDTINWRGLLMPMRMV